MYYSDPIGNLYDKCQLFGLTGINPSYMNSLWKPKANFAVTHVILE